MTGIFRSWYREVGVLLSNPHTYVLLVLLSVLLAGGLEVFRWAERYSFPQFRLSLQFCRAMTNESALGLVGLVLSAGFAGLLAVGEFVSYALQVSSRPERKALFVQRHLTFVWVYGVISLGLLGMAWYRLSAGC